MKSLIMLLNGMAIMVLEMAGARLLAPTLGTSITVWTSIIGVILASLSLGYWFGGSLADRMIAPAQSAKHQEAAMQKAYAMLGRILLYAGCFVLLIGMLHAPILQSLAAISLPLHISALCATVLLFACPSVLCGMVSPFTIRLAIINTSKPGAIIGKLNAIATIGSIAGTFLGGFILIAWFGSREIIIGTALCLFATATLAPQKRSVKDIIIPLILAAGATMLLVFNPTKAQAIIIESPYNTIQLHNGILNNRPALLMQTDPNSYQSAMYLDNPTDLAFAYTQFFTLGPALIPQADTILILGGGGFSFPKWLLSEQSPLQHPFQLDVVELDPQMAKTAITHFQAPADDSRMKIHYEDARMFLNRVAAPYQDQSSGPYSLIYGDVFNSYYSIPFHMGTQETAQQIGALLREDGIFMMNVISALDGDNGKLLRSLYQALATVFPEISIYQTTPGLNTAQVQNFVLVCAKKKLSITPDMEKQLPEDVRRILSGRIDRLPLADVPPLTDNYAPVERYTMHFIR